MLYLFIKNIFTRAVSHYSFLELKKLLKSMCYISGFVGKTLLFNYELQVHKKQVVTYRRVLMTQNILRSNNNCMSEIR